MKQILFRVLAVVLLLACLDVIHHLADIVRPLAAAETNDDLQPLITTSEFVVEENRFAFWTYEGKQASGERRCSTSDLFD